MANLQSTNVTGVLCVNGVAVGGGKDFKYCCFTASTTFTPSQDLVDGDGALNVLAVGGGGAAGSDSILFCCQCNNRFGGVDCCTEPGGGGAAKNTWVEIDSTDACTVTVGAGSVANGISWDGASAFETTINSNNGGTTTFGEVSVAGGGNGNLCGLCCGVGNPSCTALECTSTRNGGNIFGGGAQAFTYGGQFCYSGRYPGNNCVGGGKFAGNQTCTVYDSPDDVTGSVNFTMFTGDENMANLGTGNPSFFGAGGNAPIIGGESGCRDKIVDQSATATDYVTSSNNIPDRFFGAGGNGERYRVCNNSYGVPSVVEVKGMTGNDGIVVLTWYE